MKKLVLIALTLAILSCLNLAWAQNETTDESLNTPSVSMANQGFGVHFGNVSGSGYAWRYMNDKHGVQLVLGGFTTGDNGVFFSPQIPVADTLDTWDTENGRKYYMNFGVNYLKPLKQTEFTLFYLHAGLNWNYSDQKQYKQRYSLYSIPEDGGNNIYTKAGSPTVSHKISSYVNIGAGPGFEIALGRYVKLSLELPVTYTGKDEFLMYIPQAGLYYYFQ